MAIIVYLDEDELPSALLRFFLIFLDLSFLSLTGLLRVGDVSWRRFSALPRDDVDVASDGSVWDRSSLSELPESDKVITSGTGGVTTETISTSSSSSSSEGLSDGPLEEAVARTL